MLILVIIRNTLGKCPDEAIETSDLQDINFITDVELKDEIVSDLNRVNDSLLNFQWKAATIFSGSCIEAILLFSLQQRTDIQLIRENLKKVGVKVSGKEPSEWDLSAHIKAAEMGKLISSERAQLAFVVKDFRNLIHPGRQLRMQQKCDRGTALVAAGALDRIITELKQYSPNVCS